MGLLRPQPNGHGSPLHRLYLERSVAYNDGLLSINFELPWGTVACCFGLLGFPGNLRHLSIFLLSRMAVSAN